MQILGIDVGKDHLHCELLSEEKSARHAFPNSVRGFEQLTSWLNNRKARRVHACMEATGGFSDELAYYLFDRGHVVSIVNPVQIHAFGNSELSRTKTDKADAALIARFCRAMKPAPWDPPSPQERRLQRLIRRRRALVETRVQEVNRLAAPGHEDVHESLEASVAFLNNQIARLEQQIDDTIDGDEDLRAKRDLLQSIPGIGPTTSATLLAEVPHLDAFTSHKKLAAFAGVCPHERSSGTSRFGARLTPTGNRAIRSVLYFAAVSALRCNPVVRAFGQRLKERGRLPKQIIVAAMRKLLVLVHGVLKTRQPFDPAWA